MKTTINRLSWQQTLITSRLGSLENCKVGKNSLRFEIFLTWIVDPGWLFGIFWVLAMGSCRIFTTTTEIFFELIGNRTAWFTWSQIDFHLLYGVGDLFDGIPTDTREEIVWWSSSVDIRGWIVRICHSVLDDVRLVYSSDGQLYFFDYFTTILVL